MGLRQTADKMKEHLVASAMKELPVRVAEEASERTRKRFGAAIERDLRFLEEAAPTQNAIAAGKRYAMLEPVVRVATKVFNWEQEQSVNHFTLSRIDVHAGDAATLANEVIDVSGDKPTALASVAPLAPPTPLSPSEYIAPSSDASSSTPTQSEADARGASADADPTNAS